MPLGRSRRPPHGHTRSLRSAEPGDCRPCLGSAGSDLLSLESIGPPPPLAPAVINQAREEGTTVRVVRVTEPMETDGVLEESFYRTTEAISEFAQSIPDAGVTRRDGRPEETATGAEAGTTQETRRRGSVVRRVS